MPISLRRTRFLVLASAVLTAGFASLAATESAHAFPRGGAMRPAIGAHPRANPGNVEVVLKVLDGRPMVRRHGGLSNVDYTITVTDTQTGRVKRAPTRLK